MNLLRSDVTLGILAGGQARRLDGADKALAVHRGERLLVRTLAALGGGFTQTLLSYNGRRSAALPAGLQLVPDLRANFPGPLAGIEALLAACPAPWLLSVPVDLARLPPGLFECLAAGVAPERGARIRDDEGVQPLVALWPVARAKSVVSGALDRGEGAVHLLQAQLGFADAPLHSWILGNLNTPADLRA